MPSASLEIVRSSLPLSQTANRAGVALGGAVGDEVAPGARVPGLLNRRPLDGELSLEGAGFHGLPECELS